MDEDHDLDVDGGDGIPSISMDQLLGGNSVSSLRCFIARRRLEPLLEEEVDSPVNGKQEVGWWWQRFKTDPTIDSNDNRDITDRELNFAKLSQEDVEFKRKILDLHRKLSHVDDGRVSSGSPSRNQNSNYRRSDLPTSPKTSFTRGHARSEEVKNFGGIRADEAESEASNTAAEDNNSDSNSTSSHSLIRRRSMKLLSFLSGKSSDRSNEEQRSAKLLKMYTPVDNNDQTSHSSNKTRHNTISIHHTSRDRRFWKLRNRRRSSSA